MVDREAVVRFELAAANLMRHYSYRSADDLLTALLHAKRVVDKNKELEAELRQLRARVEKGEG